MPKKVILIDFDLTLTNIHTSGKGFYFDPQINKFRLFDKENHDPVVEIKDADKWFQFLEKAHQEGNIIGIVTNHGGSDHGFFIKTYDRKVIPVQVSPQDAKKELIFIGNKDNGALQGGGTPAIYQLLEFYWPQRSFLKEKSDIVAFLLDNNEDNFEKFNVPSKIGERRLIWNQLIRKTGKKAHIEEFLSRKGITGIAPSNILLIDDTIENIWQAKLFGMQGVHFMTMDPSMFAQLNAALADKQEQAPVFAEKLPTFAKGGQKYIAVKDFIKEAAIEKQRSIAPVKTTKRKYSNQIILNFQNPAPSLEDQTKFPRSGGSAFGQMEKAKEKGLPVQTIHMQADINFLSKSQQKALVETSNQTRIYINGHGTKQGDTVTGQNSDGSILVWDYKKIAVFIAKNCPQLTQQPGVTISLVMCFGGVGDEKSFASKLAEELLKVHHIQANIYGRMGAVSRHAGGRYKKRVEGKHHADGGKLLVSTVGEKKVLTPYIYSTPIVNKDYYHPYLQREEVESVFLQAKAANLLEAGEFLFRSGSEIGTFACTYVDDDLSIKHLKISNMKEDGSFDLTDGVISKHCDNLEQFTYQYGKKLKKAVPHALVPATSLVEAKEKLFAQLQMVSQHNLERLAEEQAQMFKKFVAVWVQKPGPAGSP